MALQFCLVQYMWVGLGHKQAHISLLLPNLSPTGTEREKGKQEQKERDICSDHKYLPIK